MHHQKVSDREVEILLVILRCGENAYGPAIREHLADRTGEDLSYGALYSVLDRLDEKGLVETRMGEATAERGGKRKRFYRVNGAGQTALGHALHKHDRLREGVGLPDWNVTDVFA
jgi:PadR family transcriptional regulator PadR